MPRKIKRYYAIWSRGNRNFPWRVFDRELNPEEGDFCVGKFRAQWTALLLAKELNRQHQEELEKKKRDEEEWEKNKEKFKSDIRCWLKGEFK